LATTGLTVPIARAGRKKTIITTTRTRAGQGKGMTLSPGRVMELMAMA
jgi:hypothetical protein